MNEDIDVGSPDGSTVRRLATSQRRWMVRNMRSSIDYITANHGRQNRGNAYDDQDWEWVRLLNESD
eukprot:CAMPEP_0206407136 /NCGR_PEP_ID=MMETSP0294-20121207/30277_1 /ASSEMBLY_ACC=CAM_ASM_000327 /TAXON_ID=39354 /ORGANISM="Heterosigma akashiwo, Strain CCMP2393" /LENGTH=65 /DNA_ID=CAMNT_0053866153 /DNA_START=44 /DNA_END=238 /DNA_ORIENTATION=-